MTNVPELPRDDEAELVRLAEAIADDAPRPARAQGDRAASPVLRHMAEIAEAAVAFRDAGDDTPDPGEPPLFTWGPLQVRRRLGEGSFGEVVAAWDPRLRREVALKLRREDAGDGARRWLEEARALARVRHPNVLAIYGADEHDGRAGIWTDLVRGRDLEAILAQQGPFSPREACAIGLDLCGALAAVHAARLVHGDVKTRNVMRDEGGDSPGRIVLMDFGSAHDAALALTAGRGSSVGTPLAMAPEVLRGEAATPASDLYSLGVLLFRLLTARYPVEAATLDELRTRFERGERSALRTLRPELPRPLVAAVESALDPDPRRRPADAAAFERALHAALAPAGSARPAWAPAVLALGIVAIAAAWFVRPLFAPRVAPAPAPPASAAPRAVVPGVTPTLPPAASIAAPSLRADAVLYRTRAGESLPIANGGEIEPGDRLFLQVAAGERVHAYVLDEDGAGHVVVLFPCAGAEARNPLAAGDAHRLPGARGRDELNWLVTSAEGGETFLVVLARRPIPTLEQTVAALPQPGPADGLQYAALDDGELRAIRGVGRMVRDTVARGSAEPGRLAALARSLALRPDAGDLWVRLVRVDNPRD